MLCFVFFKQLISSLMMRLKLTQIKNMILKWTALLKSWSKQYASLQGMWTATHDFQQCGILTSVDSDKPGQPFLSLETPYAVQPVAEHSSNIQEASKGSDQSAHMRSLVLTVVGPTYHTVGNLTPQLMYCFYRIRNRMSNWFFLL